MYLKHAVGKRWYALGEADISDTSGCMNTMNTTYSMRGRRENHTIINSSAPFYVKVLCSSQLVSLYFFIQLSVSNYHLFVFVSWGRLFVLRFCF